MTRCQHCERDIEQMRNGDWVDSDGICVCVKAPLGSIGHGQPGGFVLHTPMSAVTR